jgi:hypothetical protein
MLFIVDVVTKGGSVSLYTTLELNYSGEVTTIRPSNGKSRIKLATSTCTMECNELLHDNTRHIHSYPSPLTIQ